MRRTIKTLSLAVTAMLLAVGHANATVLTFDIFGISDFQVINQNYGDNVTALSDAVGSYGELGEGFTGNVVAEFGTVDPSLWTSGYSDLTNVFFDDADSQGPLALTLTADAGYNVQLYDFDLGAYGTTGGSHTVTSVRVLDESSTVLYESFGDVISNDLHSDYTFSSPLSGQSLTIVIDQIALGGRSDDIGLDNVRFGQATANQPVPEPATMTLLGLGVAGLAARARRRTA